MYIENIKQLSDLLLDGKTVRITKLYTEYNGHPKGTTMDLVFKGTNLQVHTTDGLLSIDLTRDMLDKSITTRYIDKLPNEIEVIINSDLVQVIECSFIETNFFHDFCLPIQLLSNGQLILLSAKESLNSWSTAIEIKPIPLALYLQCCDVDIDMTLLGQSLSEYRKLDFGIHSIKSNTNIEEIIDEMKHISSLFGAGSDFDDIGIAQAEVDRFGNLLSVKQPYQYSYLDFTEIKRNAVLDIDTDRSRVLLGGNFQNIEKDYLANAFDICNIVSLIGFGNDLDLIHIVNDEQRLYKDVIITNQQYYGSLGTQLLRLLLDSKVDYIRIVPDCDSKLELFDFLIYDYPIILSEEGILNSTTGEINFCIYKGTLQQDKEDRRKVIKIEGLSEKVKSFTDPGIRHGVWRKGILSRYQALLDCEEGARYMKQTLIEE